MVALYENIFPIPNSDEYHCKIHKYETTHMGLYLEVSNHRDPPFYLYFAGVRYFSGPPSWKSVDFQRVEKPEKQIEVLRGIDFFSRWSEEWLLNRLDVYRVGNPDYWWVTIVAGVVERIESAAKLEELIDKQKRRQFAEIIKFQYLGLDTPGAGKPPFTWLQNKTLIRDFVTHWEMVRDYYKGHPDGLIDSLAMFVYLSFMDDLEKAIRDTSIEPRVKAYAESVQLKLRGLMDEILHEATNSADNFSQYM
jgi:hypothetical protein